MKRHLAKGLAALGIGFVAALSGACSGAGRPSRTYGPGEHVIPEDGSCLTYTETQDRLTALVKANLDALRAAAATQGYTPVDLTPVLAHGPGFLEPLWSVKQGKGSTGKAVYGPLAGGGCGEVPRPDTLFLKGKGDDIYAVDAQISAIETNVYQVCGCESELPGAQCGAPAPPRQWYYELPKGTRFAGTVKLTAPRTNGRWEAVGRDDPPCKPMPTPP